MLAYGVCVMILYISFSISSRSTQNTKLQETQVEPVYSVRGGHLGNLGADGRLILNVNKTWVLGKLCGLNWLSVGSICETLRL
jgi:hypothetical protein